MASDGEIAFEGVMVVTPANATLVKDLTLRVPRGTNLLVTGPNGSGGCCVIQGLGLSEYHIPSAQNCQPEYHVASGAHRPGSAVLENVN